MTSILTQFKVAFYNPVYGWKTTHFWGPIANWGIVLSAVYDAAFKGPEQIDILMTSSLIGYSSLFVRFAWRVQPRNYLLFSCHVFNIVAQLNQLRRASRHKIKTNPNGAKEMKTFFTKLSIILFGIGGLIATSGKIKLYLTSNSMNKQIRNFFAHPAGPMTIFFWAPTSKWLLSANNLIDLEKPTEKISLAQQSALTATGIIWARYSFVINPINKNLAFVNVILGLSSGYQLIRKIKADYFRKKSRKNK